MWPTAPIVDVARAKKFYQDVLGLTLKREDEARGVLVFEAGKGSLIELYKRGATKADNTAMTFFVTDIEKYVNELKAAHVVFEEFEMGDQKMTNSIMTTESEHAAWFKDTEGNILCLHEDLVDEFGKAIPSKHQNAKVCL